MAKSKITEPTTHRDGLASDPNAAGREQPSDYRGLILHTLFAHPEGLTIRALEGRTSTTCADLGWILSNTEARFDYDLQALRMEGLVEYGASRTLVLSDVGRACMEDRSVIDSRPEEP